MVWEKRGECGWVYRGDVDVGGGRWVGVREGYQPYATRWVIINPLLASTNGHDNAIHRNN